MQMKDRVLILTGGAGMVGKGILRSCHEVGAKVVIVDQDEEKISAAYDSSNIPQGDRLSIVGDVALESSAETMVEQTVEKFGRLDSVVTCVYDSTSGTAVEVSLEDWNRCLAVTLTSTFLAAKYAVPAIIDTGGYGSIIAISSVHGDHPSDRYITYAAAKAGLNHLVRAMALDFSGQGVRVNGISPGGMTPLDHTPDLEQNKTIGIHYALGRYPSVEEIGHTVVFLASEQSGGITGQIITVDGGSSVPLQHTLFNRAVQSVKDDPERFGITP